MIPKYNNYEEKAFTPSTQLPAGNYIVTIKAVKYIKGENGKSDRLDMAIDVCEGEQTGFFQKQFDASTDEDKKFKGKASIWLPDDSGTEADKRSVRNFNAFAAYLANANPGYHWDWDETKLKGKKIGAAFRTEHNIIENREVSYTAFAWFCDAEEVRSGKARLAQEKFRNGATGKPSTQKPASDSWVSVPEGEDEFLPF